MSYPVSSTMLLPASALEALELALARLAPVEILRAVWAAFGSRAAILSSMQRAGTALCHEAANAGLALDVLFVDTGVLHAETLATRDALAARHPQLRVVTLEPSETFTEQTRKQGLLYLSKEGQERCCEARKAAPLEQIRGRYDVLIGALRRDEGGRRAKTRFIDVDPALGGLRVHPYAARSREDLDAYITAHPDVVVNALHAMGFPTIGCFPCTTPVRPDEDERAGRWRHLADVAYCGINPSDLAKKDPAAEVSSACVQSLRTLAKDLGAVVPVVGIE